MSPHYQWEVLTSRLEKKVATKTAGTELKGSVGLAPALSQEEMEESERCLYKATRGGQSPRRRSGQKETFHGINVPKKLFLNKINYK